MRKSSMTLGLVAGLFSCLFAGAAMAAGGDTFAIPTAPIFELLRPYVEVVVMAAVTAGLGWISAKANKYLGVQLDAKHRAALEEVVRSRINQLYLEATERAPTIRTKQQLLADLANHAIGAAPDALKHFKLGPDRLADFALGRMHKFEFDAITGAFDENRNSDGPRQAPLDLSRVSSGGAVNRPPRR